MSGIAAAFGYDKMRRSLKGAKDYYAIPSFKDYAKKGKKAELKEGYISSRTPLHSGYGRPEYSQRPGKDKFGRIGKDSYGTIKGSGSAGLYIYKDPGFQKPAPAAPAPAAAPAPLMPQISAASQQYQADAQALSDKIAKQQADFNASQAAAVKAREIAEQTRVRNFAIQSANQSRSGQTANLQIQPASSTPKTAGTQTFKKRSIASNRKQQLTSGINLGTSSLLNI